MPHGTSLNLFEPSLKSIWLGGRSICSSTTTPGIAALEDIHRLINANKAYAALIAEWEALADHCEALLKTSGPHLPEESIDSLAGTLAVIIHISHGIGDTVGWNRCASRQSQLAREVKKRKTTARWNFIRKAIVRVCLNQKITLTASDAFAESIRQNVIEEARKLGLTDLRMGTSTRSIERHITALIKDRQLYSAILEECELEGLF